MDRFPDSLHLVPSFDSDGMGTVCHLGRDNVRDEEALHFPVTGLAGEALDMVCILENACTGRHNPVTQKAGEEKKNAFSFTVGKGVFCQIM